MAEIRSEAKLLVVDDEKLVRMVISAKLKRAGYGCVAVGDVESAVAALRKSSNSFSAVITDIVMGEIDGFAFRDIVRGIDATLPMFFLTALDPEEGSGFLRQILDDPISYYMPKSVSTDVLINRIRQVVASRRVEKFIEQKMEDDRRSKELAAHIQYSMLPVRSLMTPRGFYTSWWRPAETVSGDLYEAVPFGTCCYLYVLGDIQGHGPSAALAMTAVQAFLKTLTRRDGLPLLSPADIANLLQGFFRKNLADVSYMTALICIHRPLEKNATWITCGAPDLVVMDEGAIVKTNPEKRGGLPIGLMPDTVYGEADVVSADLSPSAMCLAYTDGLLDISRGSDGSESLSIDYALNVMKELASEARAKSSEPTVTSKFVTICEADGFTTYHDDVTLLAFGATRPIDGVYAATFALNPTDIDEAAQKMAEWCGAQGWPHEVVDVVQLVLEEKAMNLYDHGFDDRTRLHEVASLRLSKENGAAKLTVWDTGSVEPSIAVATGDSSIAFEMANSRMSNHGRGRLMVRELCDSIERSKYGPLNETIYRIPFERKTGGEEEKAQ